MRNELLVVFRLKVCIADRIILHVGYVALFIYNHR